jgi:hypothetical protein
MEKKKGSKKKDDVIERDDAIEVLFVGGTCLVNNA